MLQTSNNSLRPLKIAIGVGGRFHADRLANALISLGHSPTVFSSLPKSRFKNLPSQFIESVIYPEIVYRGLKKIQLEKWGSDFKMARFGKELAKKVSKTKWDLFIGWSSFSKEAMEKKVASKQVLIRDSSHISYQMDTLESEYLKLSIPFVRDSLAEERELQEYELADEIYVLSDFAKNTFLKRGVSDSKLKVLRLGVDTSLFSPGTPLSPAKNRPLQVVYFGSLSVRKGVHYLLECSKRFAEKKIEFHCVGHVESEMKKIVNLYPQVRFYPAMPQDKLSEFLRSMDVFVFPTLEDGFGQTLFQAMSTGLVPVVTDKCGAAEWVEEGEGILIEAGKASSVETALHYLLENPEEIQKIREKAIRKSQRMGWDTYKDQIHTLLGSN